MEHVTDFVKDRQYCFKFALLKHLANDIGFSLVTVNNIMRKATDCCFLIGC